MYGCKYQEDSDDALAEFVSPNLFLELYSYLSNSRSENSDRLLKIHRAEIETMIFLHSPVFPTSMNGLTIHSLVQSRSGDITITPSPQ